MLLYQTLDYLIEKGKKENKEEVGEEGKTSDGMTARKSTRGEPPDDGVLAPADLTLPNGLQLCK